jgi:hypothetical protein
MQITTHSTLRRLSLALGLAALAAPGTAGAATLPAPTAAAFDKAIVRAQPGDVIQLSAVSYPSLLIRRKPFAGAVRIVGTRGTHLAGLMIKDSRNVELDGVTITPPGRKRANLALVSSSNVTVDGVLFDGRVESAGAGLNMTADTTDVVVRDAEFTNCGFGTRCFSPAGTRVSLLDSSFHDCLDCDFVRGGGTDVTISGNTFDRAVPGSCTGGTTDCPHDDLMQIMGGAHYTIVGNHFGVHDAGAAQLFIATGLGGTVGPDDVYVANNTFDGGDMGYAVRVVNVPLPTNVRIVNNTILTGDISSIRLDDHYADVPEAARPVVANNILLRMAGSNCPLGVFSSNLIGSGATCSATDQLGDPNLDAGEQPTAASTLVLGLADPALAPSIDKLGNPRLPVPDRGAYQGMR